MSYGFNIEGGEIQFKRDLGSPNSIKGFVVSELTAGAKLIMPLTSTFLMFFDTEFVVTPLQSISGNNILRLNVDDTWRLLTIWENDPGGVWKIIRFSVGVDGTWKRQTL